MGSKTLRLSQTLSQNGYGCAFDHEKCGFHGRWVEQWFHHENWADFMGKTLGYEWDAQSHVIHGSANEQNPWFLAIRFTKFEVEPLSPRTTLG